MVTIHYFLYVLPVWCAITLLRIFPSIFVNEIVLVLFLIVLPLTELISLGVFFLSLFYYQEELI